MTPSGPQGDSAELLALLEQARSLRRAEETTLWLPGTEGCLRAHLNVGATPARLQGLEVPIQASLVGWVWASSQALCAGPDASYFPEVDRVTGTATHAMIVLPLSGRSGTVGVISGINPQGRDCFGSEDLDAVAPAAALLGRLLDPERPA